MATKKELQKMGIDFINLEIQLLNDTGKSIFDNSIYQGLYEKNEVWRNGVDNFLTNINDNTNNNLELRRYFNCLISLVNMYYLEYKEKAEDFDRISLKVNLQLLETLSVEKEIFNLSFYEAISQLLKSSEGLNKTAQGLYEMQLDKLKPGIKEKTEAEIKNWNDKLREAKKKQKRYEETREDTLEDLIKDENTIKNLFGVKDKIDTMIDLLNRCCNCFYDTVYIKIFMESLQAIGITEQCDFNDMLQLVSFNRLQSSLLDLGDKQLEQNIHNEEFDNLKEQYIYLEAFSKDSLIYQDNSNIFDLKEKIDNIYIKTKESIEKAINNPKDILDKTIKAKQNYMDSLVAETRWLYGEN